MTSLLALALVAPIPSPVAASPYTYKPVVDEKTMYSVRFFIQGGGQKGDVSHTFTMEALTVNPDGSAHVRITTADVKMGGMAKDQEFDAAPYEVDIDPYGRVAGFEALSDQRKLTATGLALPTVELAEKTWTEVSDPLSSGMSAMVIESTIKSKRGDRVVILSRNRAAGQGQSFSRETTFDTKSGKLVSMRLRGKMEGGPEFGIDLARKGTKR